MEISKLILNVITINPHNWVRYWVTKEFTGVTLPGEYIEIMSSFLSSDTLEELLDDGFKIDKITTQMINQDAYSRILLVRKLKQ
jgi:hypothetical protein